VSLGPEAVDKPLVKRDGFIVMFQVIASLVGRENKERERVFGSLIAIR
jgi:hypothetical protein